jgi:regulator of sigma E protease
MNLLHTLLSFALALGVLIVVHEFGHYWVARRCGVKVLRFSVGFGKPLWLRRFGADGTEWAIAVFPLGGYVKMLDEREGEVAEHELGRAFNRQTVWRRILIVAAGPVANLLLAILIYWVLYMAGMPGAKPLLGEPVKGSPAAMAGFEYGELVTALDGEPVAVWADVRWALLKKAMERQTVRFETLSEKGDIRQHVLETAVLNSDDFDGDFLAKLGLTHYRPVLPPVIGKLLPDGAGAKGGLREKDEILALDGKEIFRWEDMVAVIRANPQRELRFSIQRGATRLEIALTPDEALEQGKAIGKIGAKPFVDEAIGERLMAEVRYDPIRAMQEALWKTWDMSWFSLKTMGKMLIGEVSPKNISGPITIADYAGQSAHIGWVAYLMFIALVSISLGVLNLLPVPLLDGGHLMYYMAEIVKGSPVSDRVMEIGQQIGMALLLALMMFAFYNDINRLLTGS